MNRIDEIAVSYINDIETIERLLCEPLRNKTEEKLLKEKIEKMNKINIYEFKVKHLERCLNV